MNVCVCVSVVRSTEQNENKKKKKKQNNREIHKTHATEQIRIMSSGTEQWLEIVGREKNKTFARSV